MTAALASGAVDHAIAGHARGSALPLPRLRNMEQRQSVRYIADLSRRLPAWEMALLADATEQREQALALAREGNALGARRLLAEAHRFINERIPSDEGRTSARSFHAAAEAFVDHAEGRHDGAYALLSEALGLCRRLRLEYGHTVEIRRVHLARNAVRLLWCLGRHEEAWTCCGDLLGYVWGSHRPWPLGEATALQVDQREPLRDDERIFLTDQLLSEALSTVAAAHRDGVPLSANPWNAGCLPPPGYPRRAKAVVDLCGLVAKADEASVIAALGSYFDSGPGDLPMTWRRLEQMFEDITGVRLRV